MENTTNFEQDYKKVIDQHLPAHLSQVLQEKLADLPKLQNTNKELNSKVQLLSTTKEELEKTITILESIVSAYKQKEMEIQLKESELFTKEKVLELREIRVLNEITKKEMAEKHTQDFKNVLTSVFTNKQVFEEISSHQSGQWNWNNSTNRNEFTPDGHTSTTKTTGIVKS